MRRKTAAVAGLVCLATGVGYVNAYNSYAVGGDCRSAAEKLEKEWVPDPYRVRAWCRSLQRDSRAQGVLDVPVVTDPVTPWFTALNRNYYSGYSDPPIRGTLVKIAHL